MRRKELGLGGADSGTRMAFHRERSDLGGETTASRCDREQRYALIKYGFFKSFQWHAATDSQSQRVEKQSAAAATAVSLPLLFSVCASTPAHHGVMGTLIQVGELSDFQSFSCVLSTEVTLRSQRLVSSISWFPAVRCRASHSSGSVLVLPSRPASSALFCPPVGVGCLALSLSLSM